MIAPEDPDFYLYKAHVVRVVDGDTVILDIDLGCGVMLTGERCRLLGVNCPEPRGEERELGVKATRFVELIVMDQECYVRTHKDMKGKWGRWLVELYTMAQSQSVNQILLDNDYGEPIEE